MAATRWRQISVGEFGWVGQLTLVQNGVPQDLSSFTTLEFVLTHEDTGDAKTRTATFATDGTDGVLEYTVQVGDIDAAGRWSVVAVVSRPGSFLTSAPHRFSAAIA